MEEMQEDAQKKRRASVDLTPVQTKFARPDDDHDDQIDKRNMEMLLWNEAYMPSESESRSLLLSLNKTHPGYEIQQVDLTWEKNHLHKLSSYPDLFLISNNNESFSIPTGEASQLAVKAVELYGRYVSKQKNIDHPIFSYEDYQRAKITFYAFLISPKSQGVHGILLFDNYETSGRDNFKLRFEWWHLGHCMRGMKGVMMLSSLKKEILSTVLSKSFLEITDEDLANNEPLTTLSSFIRPFINNPVHCDFPSYFLEPFWSRRNRILKSKINIAKKQITIDACIRDKDIEEIAPGYNPEWRSLYKNVLPIWEVISDIEIQMPIINPEDWEELGVFQYDDGQSPLGEEYLCLHAKKNISKNLRNLAYRFSNYLKEEEGYDFTYKIPDDDINHEIFFIIKPEDLICVGAFIFKKGINRSTFLENLKKEYEKTLEAIKKQKSIDGEIKDEVIQFWADKQLKSAEVEYEKISREENKKPSTSLFRYESPKLIQSQQRWCLYRNLSFYSHAKSHMPPNPTNVSMMMVAWIHPFERRRGILARLWPIFRKEYGIFDIDKPSDAMKKFIRNQDIKYIDCENGSRLVA